MPCTAKKFEAERPEMTRGGAPDIDAVLTTRELARVLRMRGADVAALAPEPADSPLGERSTAGKLFGASGGVMEATIRTAHFLLTGRELEHPRIQAVRGTKGVKEARLRIGDRPLGVAAVSGLANARRVLDDIRKGWRDLHFVEVMTCPGGCVAGGGQPLQADPEAIEARMQSLYKIDRDERIRTAHGNESVQRLYREFLGNPLSHRSHELLHTHYARRDVIV
jgi:NADH-quinone oxidoreductase subunit G/NADP-reducing hydrogenase subunit HndD